MAKKAERKQKLKVFRTAIGFHDAYVAAPSRKAALEAWGADANIFAQGIAEQVTDPKLMEEPLSRPGEVIRKLRGSAEEHVAAADSQRMPKKEGGSRFKAGIVASVIIYDRERLLQPFRIWRFLESHQNGGFARAGAYVRNRKA